MWSLKKYPILQGSSAKLCKLAAIMAASLRQRTHVSAAPERTAYSAKHRKNPEKKRMQPKVYILKTETQQKIASSCPVNGLKWGHPNKEVTI